MASREVLSDYQLGVTRRRPSRTLTDATFDPALREAVEAYAPYALEHRAVLIGTLALNFFAKPRYATCVEFLLPRLPISVPDGFLQSLPGRWLHLATEAELRFVEPRTIEVPPTMADHILATAVPHCGLGVASREAMIALGLHGANDLRWQAQRLADLVAILADDDVDMRGWELNNDHLALLARCRAASRPDEHQLGRALHPKSDWIMS